MKKLLVAAITGAIAVSSIAAEMTVHKSPYCGCCTGWVEIMEAKGHELEIVETEQVNDIKVALGITPNLASCHTVEAGDYFFEGHIPEADIVRFLDNPPADAAGLTVPGMPMFSPGMAPEGAPYKDFDVLLVKTDGSTQVYASY